MDSSQFQALIERYISEQCTAEEIKTLQHLLQKPEYSVMLERIMDQQLAGGADIETDYPEVVDRLKKAIVQRIAEDKHPAIVRRLPILHRWAIAAVIIFAIGTTVFWFIQEQTSGQESRMVTSAPIKQDISPGKEGAILTLADGSTIILDSLGNGFITDQSGAKVLLTNGQLAYQGVNTDGDAAVYNMMTTPKGRQFRLLLQDGTKVWLNAASSLRYPTVFTGKERRVEVTGEAYFEVAKNTQVPFFVKVDDETEIKVLGTHFNINSYKNETTVKTTLLEGSVEISSRREQAILKPVQQAQVGTRNNQSQQRIKIVNNIDIEKVMAWKNGVFNFQDATLHEVMRQLERWYDIEVVYEKSVPELEFVGKMGRDLTLSEVLRGLEMSEVHFTMREGKKLIVTP